MTAILFDFFGTLVSYSPSPTTQGFRRSHALAPDPVQRRAAQRLDSVFDLPARPADAASPGHPDE